MRGTERGGQGSERLAHGDRVVVLRQLLVAVLLSAAVAGGYGALFHRSGAVEYFAGIFGAYVVVVLSVLAAVGGRSAGRALGRVAVLLTFRRLSWVPWVVMLLVGIHAVTANYGHDVHPRDAPLHSLGWLVLAVTAPLGLVLFAVHRRELRPTAWRLMPVLLFVLVMAGSVAAGAHEQEIRQTVQPCACELP